jgi:hypothetical protein
MIKNHLNLSPREAWYLNEELTRCHECGTHICSQCNGCKECGTCDCEEEIRS